MIRGLRYAVELVLWPFDRLPDLAALTILSIVTGVLLLWVIGKTTPQRFVERARARMTGQIYEIRVFLDSPRVILLSQLRLILWSIAYVAAMLPGFVVLALPLGLFYLHLDARYGLAPLPLGEPVVVRAVVAPEVDGEQLRAEPTAGVHLTSEPVWFERERLAFFRVVVDRPGVHRLTLRAGQRSADKELRAKEGSASPVRTSGIRQLWTMTDEPPLPDDGPVTEISVVHPARERTWMWIPWWWFYWLLIATAAALGLRRRLDVAL